MEGEKTNSAPSDGLGENNQKIRALHGRTSGPTRRSTKGQWTPEEDEILRKAVARFKGKNWKKIAECFKDRTDVQCLHRWQKVLNPELIKGPWSKEEDEVIVELVNKYGPKKWSTIAQHLPGRIGKQCRERWHNHLNPSINKEAWTQEEELALIRAHQIYGNRWAELTKFLPGRTDNAIKNHWNSSVKKKLDSYLKSGLLGQFPVLPHVGNANQTKVAIASGMQNNADDSGPKGTEGEEVSECSQDSNIAASFERGRETMNVLLHQRQDYGPYENSGSRKEHNSCPPSCEDLYYPSLDAVSISVPDIPQHEGCSSQFMEQTFLNDPVDSSNSDTQFGTDVMPDISSLGLGQDSSNLQTDCMVVSNSNDASIPYQTSVGLLDASSSMGFSGADSDRMHMLISDDECCRVLFSDSMHDGSFSSGDYTKGNNMFVFSGSASSFCPSSNAQFSEAGQGTVSQLSCPLNSEDSSRISSSRSLMSAPSALATGCASSIGYTSESNRLFGPQSLHLTSEGHHVLVHSPCLDDIVDFGMEEHPNVAKDTLKLVPVNHFGCGSDNKQVCSPLENKPNEHSEQENSGVLCYEPPRFPSLDIPFFSCDLIQSSGDMQQEFSPLGIRQLMMTSMSPLTPFRLWDSPSRDNSPDAVLKNAAKTFTGTPSILKKRNRDLLSPLSDRRIDKKLETHMASTLSRDFSRLDVMFDESKNQESAVCSPSSMQQNNSGVSTEDKGNCEQAVTEVEKNEHATSDEKVLGSDVNGSQDKITESPVSIEDMKMAGAKVQAGENVRQLPGVLVEHDMNDLLLYSPDQVALKVEKAMETASNHAKLMKSYARNPCKNISSPSTGGKEQGSVPTVGTCLQSATSSSAPQENLSECDNAGNEYGFESLSIFAGTPFKRSIESPSAWKSPWFINTFLPNPSIEDISFFLSPGDRSYDALGLMKQISEQTAAAYANAQEVLTNETPKTTDKDKSCQDHSPNQENNHPADQLPNNSQLASNALMERRTLDFSECGTPAKITESGKSSAMSLSSPSSSYLLKSCR